MGRIRGAQSLLPVPAMRPGREFPGLLTPNIRNYPLGGAEPPPLPAQLIRGTRKLSNGGGPLRPKLSKNTKYKVTEEINRWKGFLSVSVRPKKAY